MIEVLPEEPAPRKHGVSRDRRQAAHDDPQGFARRVAVDRLDDARVLHAIAFGTRVSFPVTARRGRENLPSPPTDQGMARRFHTPQEVAELLRVSPAAIHRLLRRGEIPGVRIGKVWRVEDAELQRWLRHRRWPPGRRGNDRGEPCLCGCGKATQTARRFLPGHSGKLIHRLMATDGLTFDAARKAVRQTQRPRVQERLF